MIDTIRQEDVRELSMLEGRCVSIYIPTAATGRERLSGPVRLKNQVDRAHEMLVEQGMRSTLAIDLLKPISDLVADEKFWVHQSSGLAFFVADGFFKAFRLRIDVPELAIVGPTFHIRPLLSCMDDEEVLILALDGKETRLVKVAGDNVTLVELPDMPHSIAEALGDEYSEKQRQMHSVGPRGQGGSVTHGAGDRGADVKDRDLRFSQAVDNVITKNLNGAKTPLILAADEPILSIYRKSSHYPALLPDVIEGNPRRSSLREIAQLAAPIIAARKQDHINELLSRFEAARPRLTSETSIDQILSLANEGRIDILFTDPNALKWGVVSDDGRPIMAPEQASGTEDLINRAAIATLKSRGTVIEAAPPEVGETGAAALLRY